MLCITRYLSLTYPLCIWSICILYIPYKYLRCIIYIPYKYLSYTFSFFHIHSLYNVSVSSPLYKYLRYTLSSGSRKGAREISYIYLMYIPYSICIVYNPHLSLYMYYISPRYKMFGISFIHSFYLMYIFCISYICILYIYLSLFPAPGRDKILKILERGISPIYTPLYI